MHNQRQAPTQETIMAELKTKPTGQSVAQFIAAQDEQRREDCATLAALMEKATGAPPKMWGAIVGFGDYRYKYASGREGDWFLTGFAPRKGNLTLYVLNGFPGQDELLAKLGKHKTGKGCLYLNRLDDIHLPTLKKLITASVKQAKKTRLSPA
jgi:hypothetical protein